MGAFYTIYVHSQLRYLICINFLVDVGPMELHIKMKAVITLVVLSLTLESCGK